jgi:hypothetical protein
LTITVTGVVRALSLIGLALLSATVLVAEEVTLSPSPAGPQPVGTVVTWTATLHDAAPGTYEYQFSVGPAAGPAAIVQDFGNANSFKWAFSQTEGTFKVSVVVQNVATTPYSVINTVSQAFVVTSRLHNGHDTVTTTANPLVALFSATTCVDRDQIRVRFNQVGSSVSQTTNPIPCSPTNSANFYIAGMYQNSQYQMRHEILSPAGTIVHIGEARMFTTGSIPSSVTFPTTNVVTPAVPLSSVTAPILLHGYLFGDTQTATDLSGNVLWYYPNKVGLLTRTEAGGKMLFINPHSTNLYQNTLFEMDLAGNVTLQTNTVRMNEQLAQMTDPISGSPRRLITQFDHEARRLPNGNIVVKGVDEMLVTNAAQCGTNSKGKPKTCNVIGAQVLVLNPNLQLIWAWDAFDFLNINRPATLGEVCKQGANGCPTFFLAPLANDWLHMNAIQLTADGNILASLRHQDWVLKINYANGTGDGSVIWVMGDDGNSPLAPAGSSYFTMINPPAPPAGSACTTPLQLQEYAWFSHQHDANFQSGGETVFEAMDNGDFRIAACDTNGDSRGYVLSVDEINMTVTPILTQDLGYYSKGLGSAELIPGTSNYHFELGQIQRLATVSSQSMEIDPLTTPASTAFGMFEPDTQTYRSFRMQDLYTPAPPDQNTPAPPQ